MTDIARKLTHLKVKRDTGKITNWWYKRQASKIGKEQKYPRELGMMADRAARSVMDLVEQYANPVIKLKEYEDVAILSGRNLHIIKLVFDNDEAYLSEKDAENLHTSAMKALSEWLPYYGIEIVSLSVVYPNLNETRTTIQPTKLFLKGEYTHGIN